jgi:hypothetical protein
MIPVTIAAHLINADCDAAEIGDLYRRSRGSMADAVRLAIQCGQKLIAKKQSLAHGQWLPWLDDNADVLGFNTDRTARLLMAAAKRKPASDLDNATALTISRTLWGHTPISFAPKLDRTRPVAASTAEPEPDNQRLKARIIEQDENIGDLRAAPDNLNIHTFLRRNPSETTTIEPHDRCRAQIRALITGCLDDIPQAQWTRLIADVREEIDRIELEAEKWMQN